MDEDNFLELLDLYMDMAEKQDEIIHRLGKITARMAWDLKLLRNDQQYTDASDVGADKLTQDMAIVSEAMGQYREMKAELEP